MGLIREKFSIIKDFLISIKILRYKLKLNVTIYFYVLSIKNRC